GVAPEAEVKSARAAAVPEAAAAKKTARKATAVKTAAEKPVVEKAAAGKTTAKTAAAKTAATKTAAAKTAAEKPAAKKAAAAKPRAAKAVPSGRKPGRPAKNAGGDGGDYVNDDAEDGEVIPDLKPLPKRGGKRAKGEKDSPSRSQMTPEEQEARRNRLKILIKLGKDRGYLTYGEINDHLPDDLVDAEAIDGIISTFSDMGISVYDQAPD